MRFEHPAAPRRFSWIEDLALPLATSGMEAQPIGLMLGLMTLSLSGSNHTVPLGSGGTALLLLGLAWWGRLIAAWEYRGIAPQIGTVLSILGWMVALGCVILPFLPTLLHGDAFLQALGAAVVATWAWQRGTRRAQRQWEYEDVQADFKVAFAVVIGTVLLTGFTDPQSDLMPQFALTVPIFFLCGLLAVSLARLAALRRQRTERQADPTRLWLVALFTLVSVLVAAALALEAVVSFTTLQAGLHALGPVGQTLGTVVDWLLLALAWLLTPVFLLLTWLARLLHGGSSGSTTLPPPLTGTPQPTPVTQPSTPTPTASGIPQAIVVSSEIGIILLVLLVIALLAVRALQRWRDQDIGEGVEEQREGLDPRAALRRRRHHMAQPSAAEVVVEERLDPQSVRSRYREVLRAAQTARADLARRAEETPTEYETRIMDVLRQRGQDNTADTVLVDALTRAYRAERYGGETLPAADREWLRDALPGLISRLFGASAVGKRR